MKAKRLTAEYWGYAMKAKRLTAKQAFRAGWEYGHKNGVVSAHHAETVLADCLIVADDSTVQVFLNGVEDGCANDRSRLMRT